MIRALLKKQLLELGAAFVRSSKTGKQRSRVGTFGYTLLFAALMLLVMLSFGSMALPLAVTLVPQGLDWLYFVLMELSALTVSVLDAENGYGITVNGVEVTDANKDDVLAGTLNAGKLRYENGALCSDNVQL